MAHALLGAVGVCAEYTCDAENRLIAVVPVAPQAGDKKVEFVYDHIGRRVEKRVYDWDDQAGDWEAEPSLERRFIYSGWLLLLELDCGTGVPPVETVVRKYTWGLDLSGTGGQSRDREGADAGHGGPALQGAGGIGGLLAVDQAAIDYPDPDPDIPAGQYVYFYDANGNVGQVVAWASGFGGATGYEWHGDRLVAHYEYDPYGNVVNQTGAYADENPIRFSTKYWDGETGWGYWGRRYLIPRIGRWGSRDPIGGRGGHNLYRYVRNRGTNAIDPIGLQEATSQPTTQGCCYCGPDMTGWFSREMNIHAKFWRSAQRNVGISWRPLYFKRYASMIPYKWTTFETKRCPSGGQCKNTVMLCGVCIHKSELGNIMYGAIGKLWLRADRGVVLAGVELGGTDSTEDMAGVVGGLSLGDLAKAGDIPRSKLCSILKSDQRAYIARIAEWWKPGSTAGKLLGRLKGDNLQDMGQKYTMCQKCPDPPPNIPNSSFAWLKTTKHIASGDWTQSYPDWPIDWPE